MYLKKCLKLFLSLLWRFDLNVLLFGQNYVQLGDTKTRKGIPKNFSLSEVDLEYALKLLSLPREIGSHPETKEMITADYGRYGPYIKCGKQNASLKGKETPLDITLEKSIELLANRNNSSSEVKTLGEHP